MKLTQKDKKLLLILAVLIVLVIPYFFVITPILEQGTKVETDKASLEQRYTYLIELQSNVDYYKAEVERFETEEKAILAKYPTDLVQEDMILFFNEAERLYNVKMYQTNFSGIDPSKINPQVEGSADKETLEKMVQEIDNLETFEAELTGKEEAGGKVADITTQQLLEGLMVLKTNTKFSYETSYENYKRLLNYFMMLREGGNEGRRIVLDNMTARYEGEMVSGEFSATQYALKGPNREKLEVAVENVTTGVDNVFNYLDSASGQNSSEAIADAVMFYGNPDAFLMLSQPQADIDAVIAGLSGDVSGSSYVKTTENQTHKVNVIFSGQAGNYTASIQVDDRIKDVMFEAEGPISFKVISSSRMGEGDEVSAELSLANRTDKNLQVTISNDDLENPRVKITGKTGKIKVN